MSKSKTRHYYIEDLILQRTRDSFEGEPTKKNYNVWAKHWLKTAEDLKKEFEAEGLIKSVGYVDEVIAFNKMHTVELKDHGEILHTTIPA